MSTATAFLALIFEHLFGYPKFMQSLIGHPVQWMGALISWFDNTRNGAERSASERRMAGITMLVVLCGITYMLALTLTALLHTVPNGWLIEGIIASVFLAQRQLSRAVRDVANALGESLAKGREAVSHIVGRDTKKLDEAEVSRAAIETLAENASDGVIAPLFWLMLFGLPGIAVYKAINTADSMVGHLNARYSDFGWASAKLDDIVNWVPARLTTIFIALGAFFLPGASGSGAWSAARHDGPKHKSPNAGWPEAAMAGALAFGLGGSRKYDGKVVDLPEMGVGNRDLGPADIRRSLSLFAAMSAVAFVIVGIIAIFTVNPV